MAILASGKQWSAEQTIGWMFSRWLQENDFWYLDRQSGVKELMSRGKESYEGLGGQLGDREVESRKHKEAAKQKRKADRNWLDGC